VLILAGDLLGVPDGYRTIRQAQRAEAREIRAILRKAPVPIFYIMGNDDWVELGSRSRRIVSIHGRRLTVGSFAFVGYQYSPLFMGGIFEKKDQDIAADLRGLSRLMSWRTVLVTHCPAYGILDIGVMGKRAGSRGIGEVASRDAVCAHIHGHIHQCFGRKGKHFNVAAAGQRRAMLIDLADLKADVCAE